MPRVRSDNYDLKTSNILDSAAALFSREGYPAAKMQDIAKACGATKSMLYHYFPTKDDLLFAVLQEHLSQVLAALEEAVQTPGEAEVRLAALVRNYTQKSVQSRQRHMIAMNDVKYLPQEKQTPLLDLQRQVIQVATGLLQSIHPGLPKRLYKPYTLLLLGMLNWTDIWYRPEGPIKPKELCDRITRLFLHGLLAEGAK